MNVGNASRNGNRPKMLLEVAIDTNDGNLDHPDARNLPGRSVEVDRHYLPMIAFFDLLAHLCLIQSIAALGKFFFAISGLSDGHRTDLAAIGQVYFSLGRWAIAECVVDLTV